MNLWKYSLYRSFQRTFGNPMHYGLINYLKHLYYTFRVPVATWWEKKKLEKDPDIPIEDFLEIDRSIPINKEWYRGTPRIN